MNVSARVFLGTAAFGLVLAAIYWLVSKEAAGTTLLLGLGIAPLILAGWVQLHRSAETAAEDRPDALPEDAAGEELGSFPAESAWPIALAGSSVLLLGGIVYGPALLLLGGLGAVLSAMGLMRESRG